MSRDLFTAQPYLRTLATFSFLLVVAIAVPGLVAKGSGTAEQIFEQTGSATVSERSDGSYPHRIQETQPECVTKGGVCNATCLGAENSHWRCPPPENCCVYLL
ncbi:uncharacterized protein LOC142577955 [Dermacentor variabilis]|uniref:uncharacterized protein LOC142577955 n=1 Tax=Dermacentor variabilis TaxID=34621 RepID=UPI003F5C0718